MKKVKITVAFDLEISEELYKKIEDEHELEEFCLRNCFRNNSRTLRRTDIYDLD